MSDFSDDGFENESDQESLYDRSHAGSPVDGYFYPRSHPQETFVERSSAQAQLETKARAEPDAQTNGAGGWPPSQPSPVSFIENIRWPQETAPILDAGPAPPDYAAATAQRRLSSQYVTPAEEGFLRPANYGSISPGASEAVEDTPEHQDEAIWPFGNRNNPFGPGFPFRSAQGSIGSYSRLPGRLTGLSAYLSDSPSYIDDPFARRHSPQAMVDTRAHDFNIHENEALLGRRRQQTSGRWLARIRRMCCEPLSILNAFLILAIVGLVLYLVRAANHGSSTDGGTSDDSPIRLPDDDGHLGMDYDWSNGTLPVHAASNSKCVFQYYTRSTSFSFTDIADFSFSEMLGISTRTSNEISGKLWILSAPPGQDVDIQGWISYASDKPIDVSAIKHHISDDGIALNLANAGMASAGCIDVAVGLYVKEDVNLTEFSATTMNLDVEVVEGFATKGRSGIHDKSTIYTRRGDVKISYWSSRETYVDSKSGSISGRFALRDLLSIHSTSGSINVEVSPEKADEDKPLPAKLSITSNSGSIDVHLELYDIPDRDYKTYIRGHSSSVKGSIIHGTDTEVVTNSGTIDLNVLPCHAVESGGSEFATNSGSGTTNVYLVAPYIKKEQQMVHSEGDGCELKLPGTPPDNVGPHDYDQYVPEGVVVDMLRSSHTSNSGALNLIYPKEWAGTIEGYSNSGFIKVAGEGVHQIGGQYLGPVSRHYVGRKGSASSTLEFSTTSGSVDIRIGGS